MAYFYNICSSMQCFLIIFFPLCLTDSGSESGSHKSMREKRTSGPNDGNKPTRVRTVLNEKQLHTLRLVGFFFMVWTFGVTGSRWPLQEDCLADRVLQTTYRGFVRKTI